MLTSRRVQLFMLDMEAEDSDDEDEVELEDESQSEDTAMAGGSDKENVN